MPAIRIGLLVNSIAGAGIQLSYRTLFETFLEMGHDVYLFVLYETGTEVLSVPERFCCLEGASLQQKEKALVRRISALQEEREFDLFITAAEYMTRHIPVPNLYTTVHVTWSHKLGRTPWKRVFNRIKRCRRYAGKNVIAISRGIADDLVNVIKAKPKSLQVIYDPYDIRRIREQAEEKIDLPTADYILGLGSLIARKRFDLLIRAFARLEEQHLKLVIAGEGAQHEELLSLSRSLGVGERVIFCGFQPNPYPLIKNARLLALSSDSEGLPRVLVESLILKTPIVSTACADGVYELMGETFPDFIVPTDDPRRLAEAMQRALYAFPPIDERTCAPFDNRRVARQFLALID